MRIALAGKGGAGKTTISATLARTLARSGRPVVGIDADSNPNLSLALGVDRETAAQVGGMPTKLVSRRLGGTALTTTVDDALAQHATLAPDGVRVVLMGMPAHADEGCLCSAHAVVGALLGDLGMRREIATIMDMEASPEHLSRGTARHVDQLLLVTEPYYRSLETARRMAVLAEELQIPRVAVLGNKVRSEGDAEAIGAFCERHSLELVACVPWSDAVTEADSAGTPLIEQAPDGPAAQAVAGLARSLQEYDEAHGSHAVREEVEAR